MQLEIDVADGFLNVVAKGRFSLAAAKRTFLETLEAIGVHERKKVLVDGRGLRGKPELMERFFYGEFAAKSVREFADRGVSRATKFAYVLKEPVLDPGRFGETVAVNRGMHVKVFDNMAEALQWLEVDPADTSAAKDPDAP